MAAEDVARLDGDLPVLERNVEGGVMAEAPDKKKVFVIHGRYEPARNAVVIFLRSMGLEPLLFRDVRKTMGGTAQIVKVVERGMEQAQGVLALFTPEEFSGLHPKLRKDGEPEENVKRWQARPNVLFEAGLAFGRDSDRVAFVLFGGVKLFTDALGIHLYWPTNDHGPDSSRAQLRGLLAGGMRCEVNMHSDEWMTAGNFDAVIKGLTGEAPCDPFAADPPAVPTITSEVGEEEALSLAKTWLKTRPARSASFTYDQINAKLPVPVAAEMLRRVLPQVVDGTCWTVEVHEHSVALTFRAPGPTIISSPTRGW
jgi:hypothetical protein